MNNEKKIDRKKEKNSQKYLYACKSVVNHSEYQTMAKYFPNRIYWVFVTRGMFLNIIFSALLTILTKTWIISLTFFILYQIYLMIIYYVRLEHFAGKAFDSRNKKGLENIDLGLEFYDTYFIRKSEKETLTINYSEISKFVETDTNFYLEYPLKNIIIIIQKNNCSLELKNFLREIFKDHSHYAEEKHSDAKKKHNSKYIQNGMIILFIITIACFLVAAYSFALMNKLIFPNSFSFIKNAWIFWCFLPIPILSIILGFKYKKAGYQCTKNIVGGFIISIFLLIYGSFCLFPTFSVDYSEIDTYRDAVDANLPSNGELEIQKLGTYLDEDKTEYTIVRVFYDKEDVTELFNSIKNNNHWILSTKLKSELKIFIPITFQSSTDTYYSIYNSTTNEYNILPNNSGDYEIYVTKYDNFNKYLEIHKFKYTYNK